MGTNEILLIGSVLIYYGLLLGWFWLLGKQGLIAFTVMATIAANIEVLILVSAFGMEQTLGNVMFASTFLVTDILSEIYGKKEAKKAVNAGIATSLSFIIISQYWLLYNPSQTDTMFPFIKSIFSSTPRMMAASFIVYMIAQKFDVWAYHKWWAMTEKMCGNRHKYLWIRNNASTLLSQLVNTVLFTLLAFLGTYSSSVLLSIILSSYVIFIFTSLADTPVVYLARYLAEKQKIPGIEK